MEDLLIHPINSLLSTYNVLGAGNSMVNKIDINPCPQEAASLVGTAKSEQMNQYLLSSGDEMKQGGEAERTWGVGTHQW